MAPADAIFDCVSSEVMARRARPFAACFLAPIELLVERRLTRGWMPARSGEEVEGGGDEGVSTWEDARGRGEVDMRGGGRPAAVVQLKSGEGKVRGQGARAHLHV